MIIEVLDLPESDRQTLEYRKDGRTIEIANGVALEDYLRTLNRVSEGTTVVILKSPSRELGSLFGNGFTEPTEVVTDGTITESQHLTPYLEIPGATYTGWTAGQRWNDVPFDYFINTTLKAEEIRRTARAAEATKLSLVVDRGGARVGLKLGQPIAYPFR